MQSTRSTATSVEAAVREVYVAEYGRLAGWTNKLVADPDLAHDFATEAFVRLLNHWESVHASRAWLYTCVGNMVKDHWRSRDRERSAYQRFSSGQPEEPTNNRDMAAALDVREAIQALPERLRMPVLLHYFGDLSVAQVAQQLNLSEGTIKRNLYDARALLAKRLEGVR